MNEIEGFCESVGRDLGRRSERALTMGEISPKATSVGPQAPYLGVFWSFILVPGGFKEMYFFG